MNMMKSLTLASLLAVGLATAGHAQEPINPLLPTKGTREISVGGNFEFEPTDSYALNASYGPFLNPNVQVGGGLGFAKGGGTKSTTYGVFANYHFPTASATLPYVGAFFGGNNTDNPRPLKDNNSTAYGLQAGIKHFLSANVAGFGELQYRDTNTKGVDNIIRLQFGLAVYLR